MKAKHRIIEIVTIVAVMAFVVFCVRSCGEPIQAVQETIPLTILSINIEDEDCDGVVFENLMFVEPNEPNVVETFILIVDPNIKEARFSYEDGIIICDSTQEEFLEILPSYLYWQIVNKEPNGPVEIEWAEPNEVKYAM